MRNVFIVFFIAISLLSCKEEITNPTDAQISQILNGEFKIGKSYSGCISSGKEIYTVFKKDSFFLINSKQIVNDSIWKDTVTNFSIPKKNYLFDFIKVGLTLGNQNFCTTSSHYEISNSETIIYFEENSCKFDNLYKEIMRR